jgi:uncharacterized membrane protein required for colicin V production
MGLDVALGIVILVAGLRGWLQGFLYQAIRLGGLIAGVYLALPVRDQAKPYVAPYLPTIDPETMDRLLWWVAAIVSYVVIVGVLTLALKMTKRPEIPGMPPQRSRNDQFAGFLLGLAKGALVSAFLVAGLQYYAMDKIETVSWADQQAKTSLAMLWNREYRPGSRIWHSVPVRHFVHQIQRNGTPWFAESSPSDASGTSANRPVVKSARKTADDGPNSPAAGRESKAALPDPPAPKGQAERPEPGRSAEASEAATDAASRPR